MSPLHTTPPRGWRAVATTALCVLGTIASLHALTNLLGTVPWRGPVVLLLLVTAAAVAVVRSVTRTVWVPTVVGLVVATVAVLLRYGAPPGRLQLVPDLSSWERTSALWSQGVHLVEVAVVPVDVVRPLELLLAVGALLVFLAADLLAVGLAMPALAGVAFAAMWTPTIVLEFPGRGSAILWTGLVYLLLLALSVAPQQTRADNARRAGRATASAVAVVAVALVAGPVLAALPGWSAWGLPQFGSGAGGPVDLAADLDVRASLGGRTDRAVLLYQVHAPGQDDDAPAPTPSTTAAPAVNANSVGPLRAMTLLSFDGRSWHADSDSGRSLEIGALPGLLSPDPDRLGTEPDAERGTLAVVDVEVGALEDDQLPIPVFPRTLMIDGDWTYDPVRDQVDGSGDTYEGQQFSMVVEIPSLTADDLADARVGDPGDPRALEVPTSSHAGDIRDLAVELTREADTPYESAMALQSYLRSAANFTYDTRVAPARTDDAVWDFLESRQGYCVQFATAMTVMARSIGIPARVGVGFLPGSSDDGTYVITGQQSHAWPELYFEGHGWVRFEPTPAIQTGAPPPWSDPLLNAGGGARPTQEALPTAQPGPAATGQATAAPRTGSATQDDTWVPVAVTVAVVLALAALVVTLITRRRARVLADLTPEQAWARLRRSLGRFGIRWSAATTPRSAVASVQRQVSALAGQPLGDDALAALHELAHALELSRYAPQPPVATPGAAAGDVERVLAGVRAAGVTRSGAVAHTVRSLPGAAWLLRRRVRHSRAAQRPAERADAHTGSGD